MLRLGLAVALSLLCVPSRAHAELIAYDFVFATMSDDGPFVFPGIDPNSLGVGWHTYDPNAIPLSPFDQVVAEYDTTHLNADVISFNLHGSEIVMWEQGASLVGVTFDDTDLIVILRDLYGPWDLNLLLARHDPLWALESEHLIEYVGGSSVGPALMYWYTDLIVPVSEPAGLWVITILGLLTRRRTYEP